MTYFLLIVLVSLSILLNVIILIFAYMIFKKHDAINKIHNLVCYNSSTVEKNNKILSNYEQLINEEIKRSKG